MNHTQFLFIFLWIASSGVEASALFSKKTWILHSNKAVATHLSSQVENELLIVKKQLHKATNLPIVTTRSELPQDPQKEFFFLVKDTKSDQESIKEFYKNSFLQTLCSSEATFLLNSFHSIKQSWPLLAAHTFLSAIGYGALFFPSIKKNILPHDVMIFHAKYQPDEHKPFCQESTEEFIPTIKIQKLEYFYKKERDRHQKRALRLQRWGRLFTFAVSALIPSFVHHTLIFKASCFEYKAKWDTFYKMAKVPDSYSLEQAFRRGSLRLHPDKNRNDPTATRTFQAFNSLYQELSFK
ncbi:MAG: J domain-containing protein [Oligoflexales bacterium]